MALELITAEEANNNYKQWDYLKSLELVSQAIKETSKHSHGVVVNIPTGMRKGEFSSAYYVAKTLSKLGYDVVTRHDSENGSSELTISWHG